MRQLSKKQKIAAGGVALTVVVAGTGTAYAYWSANGTGSGSATTGSGTNDLTITNLPPTGLVPGGNVSVPGLISNANTKTSEFVNSVSGAVTIDSTHASAGCSASDFSLPNVSVGKAVLPSGSQPFTATLSMADTGVSQDACKGATVNIAWSSN